MILEIHRNAVLSFFEEAAKWKWNVKWNALWVTSCKSSPWINQRWIALICKGGDYVILYSSVFLSIFEIVVVAFNCLSSHKLCVVMMLETFSHHKLLMLITKIAHVLVTVVHGCYSIRRDGVNACCQNRQQELWRECHRVVGQSKMHNSHAVLSLLFVFFSFTLLLRSKEWHLQEETERIMWHFFKKIKSFLCSSYKIIKGR